MSAAADHGAMQKVQDIREAGPLLLGGARRRDGWMEGWSDGGWVAGHSSRWSWTDMVIRVDHRRMSSMRDITGHKSSTTTTDYGMNEREREAV